MSGKSSSRNNNITSGTRNSTIRGSTSTSYTTTNKTTIGSLSFFIGSRAPNSGQSTKPY